MKIDEYWGLVHLEAENHGDQLYLENLVKYFRSNFDFGKSKDIYVLFGDVYNGKVGVMDEISLKKIKKKDISASEIVGIRFGSL